jgi:hypothetical protein
MVVPVAAAYIVPCQTWGRGTRRTHGGSRRARHIHPAYVRRRAAAAVYCGTGEAQGHRGGAGEASPAVSDSEYSE